MQTTIAYKDEKQKKKTNGVSCYLDMDFISIMHRVFSNTKLNSQKVNILSTTRKLTLNNLANILLKLLKECITPTYYYDFYCDSR